MKKNILSASMAAMMAMSMGAPVFAATDGAITIATEGGTGSVPVELTAEATTFSVTLPTALPITVDGEGVVTTATDAKIVNNSAGAVIVSNLAIAGVGDWEIVDFDSADMSTEKVGAKKVAMEINGDKTTADDTISFTQSNWPSIAGVNDGDTDELALDYDAKVPAQASAISGENVADVVFTVGWDAVADADPNA